MSRSFRSITAVLAAAVGLAACTVNKQSDAPPLTGPSETALSLSITVTPDVLTQDGLSQSLVAVQTFGPNGAPQRSVPLRAEIIVGGASTDFGSLSARNIVTDANGRATVTYTAPPAPVFNNDPGTTVQILLTPVGGDYANANPRSATIRLVPPGVVGPPPSSLRADFVAPASMTVANPAVFTATVVDSTGADASSQVTSYNWSFGDGETATGRSVSHDYGEVGTYAVTLVVTDILGRSSLPVTRSVSVGQGALPVAAFVYSPQSPIINQTINFNATGSTAEPGHRVIAYSWNFGDGTFGGNPIEQKSYPQNGTYVVTLKVTDSAGRESTLFTQTITVGLGNPVADFTFSPSAPKYNESITFNAASSQAAPGRTIVSYTWSFDDGSGGDGQVVSKSYSSPPLPSVTRTFNVLLTVTDSSGRTHSVTKPVTVNFP